MAFRAHQLPGLILLHGVFLLAEQWGERKDPE